MICRIRTGLHTYLMMIILGAWTASATAAKPGIDPSPSRLMPLEVIVNGAKSGTWLLLEHHNELYATHDAFDEWRVQLAPNSHSISFKGHDYWPLSAVPGYKSKVDLSDQSLQLLFSPDAFAATRLTQEPAKKIVVNPVLPSIFFNYDLNYTNLSSRNAASTGDLGLLSELGVSTGWGVLTNSSTVRNMAEDPLLGKRRTTRLETTFTRDIPEENYTLRLGDASTRTGMVGRSVYFGGIQFGTNFSLTPGYASQPTPALTGISAAPSTMELYVNDVLRQVSTIPAGPFAIENLPGLSGNGEARMVVRDLLGRETTIVQSFFSSSQLLAKGLDDWSVEAGAVRQNLGASSNLYGPVFTSGTWRHGYTNSLTLQGRTELASDVRTIELGAVSALPWQLLGSAAIAASNQQSLGSGSQWLLGLEQRGIHSNFFIHAQGATDRFRQLGQDIGTKPGKLQIAANWGYNIGKWGTFDIGIASISSFDSPRTDTYSANYSLPMLKNGSLRFSLNRVESNVSTSTFGTMLIIPMDNNRLTTVTANARHGQRDLYATTIQNPNYENRLGWRVLAGKDRNYEREEVGTYYLGQHGVLTGDLSHTPTQNALRLGANGGLVMAGGHLFATERVTNSFALAEVAGYGNVGIGIGNTNSNRTDSSGIALIPHLAAYQTNHIQLNPQDLPVSAELDSIEQRVVPSWRSGVKVTFPVRSGRGALLKIVLDDGEAAPAGATLHIENDNQEFYVARRGEAFVTGLQPSNRVLLNWNKQQCVLNIKLPPETPNEIVRLGPLLCKGITR